MHIERANLTIMVAIPLILLAVATVAISVVVTEDAFARDGGRYSGDGTSTIGVQLAMIV